MQRGTLKRDRGRPGWAGTEDADADEDGCKGGSGSGG
jgi:hypothetical protein